MRRIFGYRENAMIRKLFSIAVLFTRLALTFSAVGVSAYVDSAAYAGIQPYTFKSVHTGGGGGYIVDVIFNTTEQNLIYAKTDVGGAYRWEPATQTWKQLLNWVSTDDWNWTGVEGLATDPVDPNNLYIAVGTYVNNQAKTNGAILRSADKGQTFTRVDMPFKMGGNMNGRGMGERLAVDPNKNNILYFGARDGNGLWKSTDSGATWARVVNFPDPGTFVAVAGDAFLGYAIGIPWVIFDKNSGTPGSPTPNIYVGVATNSSGAPNLYRSTDAGDTWEAVPGQPTCAGAWGGTITCTGGATWTAGAENSYSGGGVGYLPHSAKFDSNGTLYITYSDWEGPYNGGHGDVWKYVPSTSTWTRISPIPGSDTANNYFGYGGLAVDLQHPGTLMVAAVNSWWPQGQIWRSTNGGATWRAAWTWGGWPNLIKVFTMDISNAPWLNFGAVDNAPVPAVNLGWMMEGFNIDPFNSNRAMYGTGSTLYEITGLADPTDGDKWMAGSGVLIKSQAKGIEETSVNDLVSPPSGTAHLFSVMADVSGFRHDDLDSAPSVMYSVPYAGTYTSIDFAENNPQFLVRAGRASLDTAFTTDGGTTWVAGPTNISGATSGGTIAAAADGSRGVWAPGSGAVSYSTDQGAIWVASTGGIPSGAYVASDRVNANKFYAFGGGTVYVSADGGVSFTPTVTGLPTSGKIKAVPGIEGDVWIVTNEMDSSNNPVAGDGIYHSTNSGASFTKLTSGITYADVIGFGMHSPGSVYPAIFTSAKIDGYRTIYRSDDMGASWIKITDSQHQYAAIRCITGDPRIYGRVYIGTDGLGTIYGDTAGPPTYTVTYNANDATGGTTPADQTKTYGVDLTLAANSGSLVKTGYTFNGWNTLANGLGIHYDAGGTYTANTAATLYAEWTLAANILTIYKAGTGDGTIDLSTGAVTCGSINWSGKTGTAECNDGAQATLTASPDGQSVLGADTWSGDCNGNNPCGPISMTVDHSVTATFDSKANFTWYLFPGFVVSFTDTSINLPSSWQWSFGDTATSASQDPDHTYAGAGDYSVTLQASWPGGGAASMTKTVTVAACSNREAHIHGSGYYGGLSDTYAAVSTSGGIIDLQATDVGAAPIFENLQPITLKGGYDCDYTVSSWYSFISGQLVISGQAVTVDKIIVK